MPPIFLPGMPDGAIRINPAVSQLSKEGRVTWFVGDDNYLPTQLTTPPGTNSRWPPSWTTAMRDPVRSPPRAKPRQNSKPRK